MSEPKTTSTSLPWYLGSSGGPAVFRRMEELSPYETDYFGMEGHLGVEPLALFDVQAVKWRSNLVVDGEFSYTGGSEMNLGSHRTMFMAHTGLRNRFFLSNSFRPYLDLLIGIGGSKNHQNFGKGIPLPTDWTGNAGGKISIGIELCPNDLLCIAPNANMEKDISFGDLNYYGSYMSLGIELHAPQISE